MFLGPLDLTASIDRMGRWGDPQVVALLREAEHAVLASSIALGGALLPGESASACLARGYRFVTAGSDVTMLRQGAAQSLG
jgi:2-keto-3-deoxy-L-rhamnonate aldolase RhmA